MPSEPTVTEGILHILRPYASNWTGTLGRGDLVIPQRDIPRLVRQILEAVHEAEKTPAEASDEEIFRVLSQGRRTPSIQDAAAQLKREFIVLKRDT
jgi:hypothetical protein